VFLISEELKTRKLLNALASIGCDGSFCTPDLCDLVFAYVGFNDRPEELYDFYFRLLDKHCQKVTSENSRPVKEALEIYSVLLEEKRRRA